MNKTTLGLMLVAALLAIHLLFIVPLDESREELQERLFIEHKALLKHEQFISSGADAQKELKTLRKKVRKMEKSMLAEKDSSLALAALQSRVQDMAEGAGLKINSVKPLEPLEHEGYREMALFVDASGEMDSLSAFLKMIDRSSQLISLEKINMATAPRGGLRIKMQLSGLMKQ